MPFTIVLNLSCHACHAANVRLVDFTDPQVRRDSLASWTPGVAQSTAESSGTVPKATSPAPPPHPLRSSQLPPVVRRLPQRSPEPRRVRPRLAFGPVDSVEATLQDETVAAVAASLPKTPLCLARAGTFGALLAPTERSGEASPVESDPMSGSDGPPPLVDSSSESDDPDTIAALQEVGRASFARAAEIRAAATTLPSALTRVFANRPWAAEEGWRLHLALSRSNHAEGADCPTSPPPAEAAEVH